MRVPELRRNTFRWRLVSAVYYMSFRLDDRPVKLVWQDPCENVHCPHIAHATKEDSEDFKTVYYISSSLTMNPEEQKQKSKKSGFGDWWCRSTAVRTQQAEMFLTLPLG